MFWKREYFTEKKPNMHLQLNVYLIFNLFLHCAKRKNCSIFAPWKQNFEELKPHEPPTALKVPPLF